MAKTKHYQPPKVDTLIDDIVEGKLAFPMDNLINAIPKSALKKEFPVWLRHGKDIVEILSEPTTQVFVLNELDNTKERKEIYATCKVLAAADLFRLPYKQVWLESESSSGVKIATNPNDYNSIHQIQTLDNIKGGRIGVLVEDLRWGLDDLGKNEGARLKEEYIDKQGLTFYTFLRTRTKKGLRWFDLLHGSVLTQENMLVKEGFITIDTSPLPIPNIVNAVKTAYLTAQNDDGKSEWQKLADLERERVKVDVIDSLSELSCYMGRELVLTFIAALNTSWVKKTKQVPGNEPRVSTRLRRNRKQEVIKNTKKRSRHRPYVLIDSFQNSMQIAARKGMKGNRKPVRPHMRRGHIHRFWKGPKNNPEKRWLISKYVEATWINKADADEGKPQRHYQVKA